MLMLSLWELFATGFEGDGLYTPKIYDIATQGAILILSVLRCDLDA